MTKDNPTLKDSLNRLKEIADWFESVEEIDVEAGLNKIREGAKLIKISREKLGKIENEFKKVKEDLKENIPSQND